MKLLLSLPGVSEWWILILILIALCLALLPTIFYLITLQNTLKEVSYENRKMQPSEVWLMLIPLFGLVWQFIIINRIADSLKSEFDNRNISVDEERPGYSIGLTYCILFLKIYFNLCAWPKTDFALNIICPN